MARSLVGWAAQGWVPARRTLALDPTHSNRPPRGRRLAAQPRQL